MVGNDDDKDDDKDGDKDEGVAVCLRICAGDKENKLRFVSLIFVPTSSLDEEPVCRFCVAFSTFPLALLSFCAVIGSVKGI